MEKTSQKEPGLHFQWKVESRIDIFEALIHMDGIRSRKSLSRKGRSHGKHFKPD